MKSIVVSILFLYSLSALATGGFECTTKSGSITVSGTIGAGGTLLNDIYISHEDLANVVILPLSMKWVKYQSREVKASSYNAMEDITRLNLEVENGRGRLSLNLADMKGGNDILVFNKRVYCQFE